MKKIWLLVTLLIGGLLLTGCNKAIENCEIFWECIGETDMDVLEWKCWEYLDKNFVANGEFSQSPSHYQIYMNSWDLEYIRLESEFIDPYYWIKWYIKVWDLKQDVICNIYPNWWIHDIHFYNDTDEPAVEEPEELTENNEDSVSCNDIDIDWNVEIINIDDVVENCTYEEWTAYSWNDWWCWWVMPHLYITKDIIWYFDTVDKQIKCKSKRVWIIKDLWGDFEDLATFWYKRGISKKSLIDVLEARTEEEVFQNGCWFYFCNGDICNQFYRPSYWENEYHYYIYWYRYPKEFPYETVVLVDDKLYNIWRNETMFDDSYWPNPMKQWKWVVYWLDWDKLIVKRYVDWELISPYTLENFNSYNFDEKKTTTKFKVKTCEIPL